MTKQALLLIAHGSRDAEARREYIRIRDALAARLPGETVIFSVLEFPDEAGLPSIGEGWLRAVAAGARRVVALPFFLFSAGHVRDDLPAELERARATDGRVALDLQPPLGLADELLDVLEARVEEAVATMPARPDGPVAVLLVGAGTSDPDANSDMCKAARLLWERRRYPLVEVGWVSLTQPTVPEAVDRCVALGATAIAVAPYFLNTGVLLRRIDRRLGSAAERHSGVPMRLAGHMGVHPRLLDLLARRARQALDAP